MVEGTSLIKLKIEVSEHTNCKKKLLTFSHQFLLHIILLLLDQMHPPEPIQRCNKKSRFFKREIAELPMKALSGFVNMIKIGHRYVIQYFHLKGLSPTNIKAKLDSTLEESTSSFTIIKYWVGEFERSRTSCQDEHRSGQPNEVATTKIVEKIQNSRLCIKGGMMAIVTSAKYSHESHHESHHHHVARGTHDVLCPNW